MTSPALSHPGAHILIVDDEPLMRELVAEVLANVGYVVTEAPDGAVAIRALSQGTPDLMLLDLRMAGIDGWDVLEHVATLPRRPRVLVMTGRGEVVPPGALAAYITGHLLKPFQMEDLYRACDTALRAREVEPVEGTRKEPRRNYLAQAVVIDEDGMERASAALVQVSEHGFRMDVPLAFEPGDAVRLTVSFPGRERPMKITGRVCWRQGTMVGAEIAGMDPEDAVLLRELVAVAAGR
jgi:CheY-like chemotaxis protein